MQRKENKLYAKAVVVVVAFFVIFFSLFVICLIQSISHLSLSILFRSLLNIIWIGLVPLK